MASFIFRDRMGRVYPSPSRRLAPDFFFHPQIYRQSGETVMLPPGTYQVEVTPGPGVPRADPGRSRCPQTKSHRESFRLKRWINLAKMDWFSGDHHVHAAGCAHYESPTEGVKPEDMWRHILGEDLDVGCVLLVGTVLVCPEAVLRRQDPPALDVRVPDALRRRGLRASPRRTPAIFACCDSRKTTTRARPGSRNGRAGTCRCSSGASRRGGSSVSRTRAGG